MKFYIVESTLTEQDPRDFDLLGVMDDDLFRLIYGLTPEQFIEEGRTGEWSQGRIKWKDECIGAITYTPTATSRSYPHRLQDHPRVITEETSQTSNTQTVDHLKASQTP